MNKITSLFDSRRFWVALLTALLAAFGNELGLSSEAIQEITVVATGWIVGDSLHKTGATSGLLQSS